MRLSLKTKKKYVVLKKGIGKAVWTCSASLNKFDDQEMYFWSSPT